MKIVIIPDDEDYEDAVAVGLMVNTALSDAPDVEAHVSTMQPDAVLVACFPTFRPRQMDDHSGQAGTPRPRSSGVVSVTGSGCAIPRSRHRRRAARRSTPTFLRRIGPADAS